MILMIRSAAAAWWWFEELGDLGDGFGAGFDVAHDGAWVSVAALAHRVEDRNASTAACTVVVSRPRSAVTVAVMTGPGGHVPDNVPESRIGWVNLMSVSPSAMYRITVHYHL